MSMSAKKAPRAHEPLPLAGRNVAVIGLGSMGGGMAASLLRAGANVRGYDPSSEALARFSQLGGAAACDARHAVEGAEFVLSVVVNAEQTEQLLFGEYGCLEHMLAGALFISCATMSPANARSLGERLQTSGRLYLDAPMSGGAAELGKARKCFGGRIVSAHVGTGAQEAGGHAAAHGTQPDHGHVAPGQRKRLVRARSLLGAHAHAA